MNLIENQVEKSALLIRLERNQKDLLQLKSKLNSYICEPRTQYLFERIELLRQELETLSETREEIIAALKGGKKSAKSYLERGKKYLLEFKQIQQSVEQYVVGARNYQV